MEKIILKKQAGANIRKDGRMIRISAEVDDKLESLSEQTGHSKTRIADVLLKKAIDQVEVVDVEEL